jgi:hypothetical protein
MRLWITASPLLSPTDGDCTLSAKLMFRLAGARLLAMASVVEIELGFVTCRVWSLSASPVADH